MLVDSHAHVNFEDFKSDWQEVIANCLKENVWLNNVGAQYQTSRRAVEIAGQYDQGVYASVGLHPIHVVGSDYHPEDFEVSAYEALIKSSDKVVAIGETGIDFYHDASNFANQKQVLIGQLNLAKSFDLPVILHARNSQDGKKNAYEEIIKVIREQRSENPPPSTCLPARQGLRRAGRDQKTRLRQPAYRQGRGFGGQAEIRGVIHCFGGTVKEALAFLELGFFIGFTGIITFDKTGQLAEVIKSLPLDAILVETDCPYLAPMPHRGERNLPPYVKLVAQKIAEIRQIDYSEIEKQTVENTTKLFNLK